MEVPETSLDTPINSRFVIWLERVKAQLIVLLGIKQLGYVLKSKKRLT